MKIIKTKSKSLGEKIGLRSGSDLLSINGHKISDNIDLRFFQSEEELDILYADRKGRQHRVIVEKEYDDALGITLAEPQYHRCGNKCIFCFVDQMPRGLRKALYFKDEDFRLSFLHGNYITLSNMGRRDLDRIRQQRLSPLYISVHTTDKDLRMMMLGSRRELDIKEMMADLVASGIELHTQIVLCPGINDGRHLRKTISDLIGMYPGVKSIAVVPVGLSKHRRKLYDLKPIDKDYSRQLIAEYKDLQIKLRKKFKKTILYFADEFYLNAGLDFPESIWYDDYPQIDNGVGMVRSFWDDFKMISHKLPKAVDPDKNIILITGISGKKVLEPVVSRLNRIAGISCQAIPVKNRLFGDSVTVSGLLAGEDIIAALDGARVPGTLIVLPENVLNTETRFLDDMSLGEFRRSVKPSGVVVGLEEMIKNI